MKTGMLASAPIISAIARSLTSLQSSSALPPLVVDPVTVSTSGHTLLPANAIDALQRELVPLGTLLTPNIPEASALLGDDRKIEDVKGMMKAGRDLCALGCKAVLIKGGHLPLEARVARESLEAAKKAGDGELEVVWPGREDVLILERATEKAESGSCGGKEEKVVVDVLFESSADGKGQEKFTAVVDRVVETSSTHGTGCTLSAAIAVFLGRGMTGSLPLLS
jgi:hydroxymethylpyrimidine/phosphomethylpyrimidine kinase